MKVAIVGAGVSGLSSAFFLLEKHPTCHVEIFEKSKGLGGRMATRRIPGDIAIDTGCQFVSIDDESILEFFEKVAPKGTLKQLPAPILCLPEGWVVEPEKRYYFSEGMSYWAKALVKRLESFGSRFQLHLESPIASIDDIWKRGFDTAIVSVPAPQAKAFGLTHDIEFAPSLSLIFSWHEAPVEALDHYAYRDISARSGVTWLAHEGLKRAHPGLWVAQVSADKALEWKPFLDDPEKVEDILSEDLSAWIPLFAQGHKTLIDSKFWNHAFPSALLDPTDQHGFEKLEPSPGRRVFFVGDSYRGVGRLENAIESAKLAVNDLMGGAPTATSSPAS